MNSQTRVMNAIAERQFIGVSVTVVMSERLICFMCKSGEAVAV
ncbi:HTH myb-type domain-containing protein [Psidium guajava]|nr:HTH myb-type domain-containing protein [Psidium guajava]